MDKPTPTLRRPGWLLLLIAYLGFISLGLPDAVAGVAWPKLRDEFTLSQAGFGWLFVATGVGYFLSSFFSGRLIHWLSVGPLLTASSLLVGLAMLGNGFAPYFWVLAACGIFWGLGSGAIDAGLNGYVASHFSAKHVSWLHACYSTGATLGPLIMTASLLQAGSWRIGYIAVGSAMLAMSSLFLATQKRWSDGVPEEEATHPGDASIRTVLREPIVWIQIVVFFLYTGLESAAGQWSFTLLTERRGMSTEAAGILVGCYYAAIALGRLLFGMVAEQIGLDRLVRLSTITVLIGAALFAFAPLAIAAAGLILVGFGLASIFPTLMTRTPQRLGRAFAHHAIGFQVSAAMLGAAALPSLIGIAIEQFGLESIARGDLAVAAALWGMHELLLARSGR